VKWKLFLVTSNFFLYNKLFSKAPNLRLFSLFSLCFLPNFSLFSSKFLCVLRGISLRFHLTSKENSRVNFFILNMLGKRKYAGPASGAKRQTTSRAVLGRNLTRTLLPPVRMGANARAPARWAVRQGELKGVDTSLALSPVIATTNTNASAFTINLIPPGTASYNRVGRKTYPSSLRLFGEAFYTYGVAATTANVAGSQLRMVVVWDKQPGGAVPAFDTIFGHTLQDGTEACVFTDPLRFDNTDRFHVIRDYR